MSGLIDPRQAYYRGALPRLSAVSGEKVNNLLTSINYEHTRLLQVSVSSATQLAVGPAVITNPYVLSPRILDPIAGIVSTFAGGTVDLPATGAGNITSSTGFSLALGLGNSEFVRALVYLTTGDLIKVQLGTPAISRAAAEYPAFADIGWQAAVVVISTDSSGNVNAVTAADIENVNLYGSLGLFPDGSVTAPSISFALDSNTGFYRTTADQIDVAANGVKVGHIGDAWEIGTVGGTETHVVNGDIHVLGDIDVDGTIYSSLAVPSDIRLKVVNDRISPYSSMELVNLLSPVMYQWTTENRPPREHYGFIAQEVQAVIPLICENIPAIRPDEKHLESILTYSPLEMIPILVSALQYLYKELETLKNSR